MAVFDWATEGKDPPTTVSLVALVPATLAITYVWLAHIANFTRVRIVNGLLHIEHDPLPWPGRWSIEASQIQQVKVEKRVWASSDDDVDLDDGEFSVPIVIVRYDVIALTMDGRSRRLVSGLDRPHQARYLEQQIKEQLWRLVSRPVDRGVHSRSSPSASRTYPPHR